MRWIIRWSLDLDNELIAILSSEEFFFDLGMFHGENKQMKCVVLLNPLLIIIVTTTTTSTIWGLYSNKPAIFLVRAPCQHNDYIIILP